MTGVPFLERDTRQVPILYISEEPDTLLAARAGHFGFEDSWPIGWLTHEPGMSWEKCIYYIKRYVWEHKNPLVICDTLARFWSAQSENDASQVTQAMNPILEIVRNSEAAFFGIHHNRKQGGGSGMAVRGSTALTGGVDIIMELARTSGYDRSNVRRLMCESRYGETPQQLQLRLEDNVYHVEDSETVELEPKVVMLLQTMEAVTLSDICFLMDIPETTARRLLTGLTQRQIINREGTGTSRSPYRYSLNVLSEN